jgi:hypothetical protein
MCQESTGLTLQGQPVAPRLQAERPFCGNRSCGIPQQLSLERTIESQLLEHRGARNRCNCHAEKPLISILRNDDQFGAQTGIEGVTRAEEIIEIIVYMESWS